VTFSSRLASDLISSDVRYFELGARIDSVAGVRLAWMPGLADVLAACVVLDADSWSGREDATSALDAMEERVAQVGGSRVRLYVEREVPPVAMTLRERGYSSRVETGYVLPRRIAGAERVSLQPVVDDAGWALKRTLHHESPDAPDGHDTAPERWVELEQRKSGPDGLQPWLICVDGSVAGTVGTMVHGEVMRLKNILVRRDLRRRGIASAAVAAFGIQAEEKAVTLGLISVEGTPGDAVYRGCGMKSVTRWVEWLGPPVREKRARAEER
jgi:GNAT superfamily N-acetyltransferase